MLIVACRTFYPMITLIRIFFFLYSFEVILSAINYVVSEKCSS